jgi:hypothetical protein
MLPVTVLALIPLLEQEASLSQGELARAAKNPYDLARFIDSHLGFDWGVLWKALGTEGAVIQPCGRLSDGRRGCSTELITVLSPDQAILLAIGDATPADIYIRFLHEKERRLEVRRSTGGIHSQPSTASRSGPIHWHAISESRQPRGAWQRY